jgi:hypothetical protein
MLDALKRWLGAAPAVSHGWPDLADWARSRQCTLRGVRENDGFVIDGHVGATPWRLEWGAAQRPYIDGAELRIRAELAVPRELQALVLNRELAAAMERVVFEQYVEGVQTRIDTHTPPEMRWLVMFPKLSGTEMQALRERYIALSGFKPWLLQWLGGTLQQSLVNCAPPAGEPLVMMVARRRLSLRGSMPDPTPALLSRWLRLFECALVEARRVSLDYVDQGVPSTQPSLFSASALPAGARR